MHLSLNQTPDILAPHETDLNYSIDSGNFSLRVYLPLMRKDCVTHIHGLAVYVKYGLPFARDVSLENMLFMFLTGLVYNLFYFY